MIPTVAEIRAQVAAVLQREPDAKAIGIFTPGAGNWPRTVAMWASEFTVRYCDSTLAVRQALNERGAGAHRIVLLTPLSDRDLGADVIARLARARLFHVRQWEMVRHAFRAISVDQRLAPYGWMAEALIERMPPEGYPPVASGVLDADTAWRTFLRGSLRLDIEILDLDSLLVWTAGEDAPALWTSLSDEARSGMDRWVEETLGPAGRLLMGAVAAGWVLDAIPLGLIVDLVFGGGDMEADLAAAAVRLERFTSGQRLEAHAARKWADAAVRVLRQLDDSRARAVLARADQLLGELYLQSRADGSSVLSAGFAARLTGLADRLERFLHEPAEATLLEVERLAQRVREHWQAGSAGARLERVDMAVRLARWLVARSKGSSEFTAEVNRYVRDGAFADWARWKLLGGDPIPALSRALSDLAERARIQREEENHAFAIALANWNDVSGSLSGVVPVERVLESVVAPLAALAPVLVLVADGLSLSVFHELSGDLLAQGWEVLSPVEGTWSAAAMATFPTVTEISRTSLFAGRITSGNQQAEKSGFAQHAALLQHSRGRPPVLFHKGELGDGVGLASEVQEALRATERRAIGIVYNAIDDQLSGASQLQVDWRFENLPLLATILHEAQGAGRILVLTSDHGHVIDHESRLRAGGAGDRWRLPDGTLESGEITIEGGRVLTPSGGRAVTVPWSERLRYGAKKRGYHGGISPQEVMVPLCVLARFGTTIPGWRPAPTPSPEWWYSILPRQSAPPSVDRPSPELIPAPRAARSTPQGDLFDRPPVLSGSINSTASELQAEQPMGAFDWISNLLGSPIYQTQRALAARVAPSDEVMRRLLDALSARGGKLAPAALATRMGVSQLRLPGLVSAARRVLNLDQQPVLSVDETSGTIELNRPLLDTQFELGSRDPTC